MGKSFFEKRPVFSIRKLSVGACSVVIGISALGLSRVHAEEKPALESEPTSIETPSVVTENSEAEVPGAGARVSEAPAVITLPELRKSQPLKERASLFLLHLSVLQERKKLLLQIKSCSGGYCARSRT